MSRCRFAGARLGEPPRGLHPVLPGVAQPVVAQRQGVGLEALLHGQGGLVGPLLGGALQLPREPATLHMDLNMLVPAFVVVVVGFQTLRLLSRRRGRMPRED